MKTWWQVPILLASAPWLAAQTTPAPLVTHAAFLKASNAGERDEFGFAVAASEDTVVVGAPTEASGSTGVDGDPDDDSASGAGAAYVFVRDGVSWSQQAYLKASNTDKSDSFGRAVAMDGDTIVVGAPIESSGAMGVDGDQDDDSVIASGAAYVFVRAGATWTQQAYLKASDPELGDQFGSAVSIDGDTLVVGARGEDSSATGVGADQSGFDAVESGGAYVYVRDGTTWSLQASLKASNTGAGDRFGKSVSVSGDTLVVGASHESGGAVGVDGDQGNDDALESGAAYVFARQGTTWSQQAYLKASNTETIDRFGESVAISGDTIAVGAYGEDSNATGVNGGQSDDTEWDSGAAYVFARQGTTWSQQAYLKSSNAEAGDLFGVSIALSENTLVVGALDEDGGASGVDGDQGDDGLLLSGAAYAFSRDGATWIQTAYLKSAHPMSFAQLGRSVAVSADLAVVGAFEESSDAVGVDGVPGPGPGALWSGAADVFDLDTALWADAGCALDGVAGEPVLAGSGPLEPGSANLVDLVHAAPLALAGLFLGTDSASQPLLGGVLKPAPISDPVLLITGQDGTVHTPFVMPAGFAKGSELWAQWAIVDPIAVQGVSFSNALRAVTP
jgi:hypothetical protein